MTNPLKDPDQRIVLFQSLFSDTIPHNKALGLKVVAVRRGFASMRLEWRDELVGNPETGNGEVQIGVASNDLEAAIAALKAAGISARHDVVQLDPESIGGTTWVTMTPSA